LDGGFVKLGDRTLDDPASNVFVPSPERRIGVVFQDSLLFPHLDVRRNIEFGPRSQKRDPDRTRGLVDLWIDRLDLGSLQNRRPSEHSGGEVQRVAIARTMVTEPDLLMLDEPLAAIDASARPSMRRILADFLEDFDGPAIVITHDPAEAFLLANDVIIIESGQVTQAGSPDEIRMRPATPYAADLAGVNLVVGTAAGGTVAVGSQTLHIADSHVTGEVVATIHPRAISLHRHKPEGSAMNSWQTTAHRLERRGDTVRVATGDPLELIAEVTIEGASAIGLVENSIVWVSIKATEIDVRSAAGANALGSG
jgi:molybdate transport system ATP-binding protein